MNRTPLPPTPAAVLRDLHRYVAGRATAATDATLLALRAGDVEAARHHALDAARWVRALAASTAEFEPVPPRGGG